MDEIDVGRQRLARHDGWSPAVRRQFIETLANTGNVATAAHLVGKSKSGAYQLRNRDDDFARAWRMAIDIANDTMLARVRERVMDGAEKTIFHNGKAVGSNREYSDRLAIYMLDRMERMGAALPSGGESARGADLLCDELRERLTRAGVLAAEG